MSFTGSYIEAEPRFWIPKTFDEAKYALSILFRNLRFTRTNGRENDKAKERTEPGGVFKDEDIGLDVQELTESIENENATSLNYWQCKFVQELQISRVDDIPLGRFKMLSVA